MSDVISQADGRRGRVAAIYARVSSERQRQDETIQSQTVGLRELAAARGLLVVEGMVFEDEGFSGATLQRPALERLRDRAAEGCFEVLLCLAPDRLARRYAYQVLLLEELARVGVEVVFAKEPERGATPEDELLRQFQGMIAEYERAQIAERTRRGKAHRARGGSQAVMSGALYGYRYVKKTEHCDAYWEIDELEAQVVRDVFARYVHDGASIGELARWLTERGVRTRKGKTVWDRSTVWAMLRNPAYRGQAAFGKTKTAERHGAPTRTTRARGERHGRRPTRHDQPAEQWTFIPVPAIVSEETFELAQARLVENARFSRRNTKQLTLLQGVLVCRECGYSCYRTCTRTSNKRISYYRCIGQDGWRHVGGRVCQSRPIRADELDALVWGEVRQLLEDPALVRAEIDRRLAALRTEHPAARRRETLQRDLTRAEAAITRLIEAYQEQLISLDELRARTPTLRKRQATLSAQLDALDAELHEAETYLHLADTLEGFLGRLADGLDHLDIAAQQRILRLVVREVLIGGDDDKITIRHSIPTPTGPSDPSYLLRGSSHVLSLVTRARTDTHRRAVMPSRYPRSTLMTEAMSEATTTSSTEERHLLAAARGGDQDAYRRLVEPRHAELHAHCYRMLGSLHDAEDALQDALLRAWRGLSKFEGRSSVRSWLYRIATNTCLDVIARRPKRVLPIDYGPAANPHDSPGEPLVESVWVEPYPDRSLDIDDGFAAPEARYEQRESLELAFIAALQHLPANQRAALILREVLGFSAQEVAETLETTVASVTSALQRARTTVDERLPEQSQQPTLRALGDEGLRDVVQAYTDALQRGDVDAVVALLTEDATWSMPPMARWYRGSEAVGAFLTDYPLRERWRHVPTQANGQLAVGCYMWSAEREIYVAAVLDVLTLRGARIIGVTGFLAPWVFRRFGDVPGLMTPELFGRFGLPEQFPA